MKRSAFLASLAAMFGVAKAQEVVSVVGIGCGYPIAGSCAPLKNGECSVCRAMADPFPHNPGAVMIVQIPGTDPVDYEYKQTWHQWTQHARCKRCNNVFAMDSIDPKDMPKEVK